MQDLTINNAEEPMKPYYNYEAKKFMIPNALGDLRLRAVKIAVQSRKWII